MLTKVRVRNATMLILVGMALTVPPNAHAQRVVNDVSTVDGGGLPTPDEIASRVQTVATPKAIIDRIISANQNAPHIASMDFVASLRVRRPLSAPPDCVFEGAVKLQAGHRSATVNHLTPGLLCFAVNRTIISKLFEGSEPFATLLARFDFQVLGEKVVNGDQSYLVQGKARESKDDPKAMIGWVDYDRGLVTEATMQYATRTIDLAQNYTSANDAWVLTYQYVNIPSLVSTVEISYSKITLAPVPAARVPSQKYRSVSAALLTLVARHGTAGRNLRDNHPKRAGEARSGKDLVPGKAGQVLADRFLASSRLKFPPIFLTLP